MVTFGNLLLLVSLARVDGALNALLDWVKEYVENISSKSLMKNSPKLIHAGLEAMKEIN